MKKIISLLLALTALTPAFAAETAASVMQKVASKLKAMPAMEVDFTVTYGGSHDRGSLTVAGEKFIYLTKTVSTWYDGTTQWAYLESSGEVNITEPTDEEVLESNPLAIINAYASRFNVKTMKEGGGAYTIRLTPKAKGSSIASADITVNASTWLPTGLTIDFSHGATAVVAISAIRKIAAPAAATFKYPKNKFPGAQIIDLR